VPTGGTGFSHRNFTAYPSVCLLNRSAWTIVTGLRFFEEMQDMLRAISRPHCKQAVIGVL